MTIPTTPFTPSSRLLTPYFEALDRHELIITRCTSCDVAQFPPRAACSTCGAFDSFEWIESTGRGTIWTFGIFHKIYFPNFGPAPYNVAVVELDEGTKLITNIVDADNTELAIGMRVRAGFVDIDGHTAARFTPDPDPTMITQERNY
ncbi:Zn-ribbon domain-containing OB-fold protein [Rhodococcus qingshengii]|uniref:Zn-ribbon domain-containing OB-fold protein n=1 Tax=Rhodococcus qingshengii TaxID=334542 RepID=A0AAW6LS68_RHOSG|nr:Zn-ribbon domain-containing OB-fold protein [Rhodococcus qingshengii]MDE8649344.1 Zn-ribbon domain-containing OB-fold protein [Rhodococcus qingshengii]